MKDILDIAFKARSKKAPQKPKQERWKKPPTIPVSSEEVFPLCRILPFFAANNYDYLETLPRPNRVVKDTQSYVINLKSRIETLKNDLPSR